MMLQEKSNLRIHLKYVLILLLAAFTLTVYAQKETLLAPDERIRDSTEIRKIDTKNFLIIKKNANGNAVEIYRDGTPVDSGVIVISYDATYIKILKDGNTLDSSDFRTLSVGNDKVNVSSSNNFNMDDVEIVLIDGELKRISDFNKINPKDIKSIGLSVGDYSELYGEEAKKGILRVTTKSE